MRNGKQKIFFKYKPTGNISYDLSELRLRMRGQKCFRIDSEVCAQEMACTRIIAKIPSARQHKTGKKDN